MLRAISRTVAADRARGLSTEADTLEESIHHDGRRQQQASAGDIHRAAGHTASST